MVAAGVPPGDFAAVTLGRDSVADGLGGFWVWDASFDWTGKSAYVDGDGVIVKAGSNTGAWKRQYTGAVDIRWFGADPTGVADSTAAFKRAWYGTFYTSPGSGAGVEIIIPSGTYLIDADNGIPWSARRWRGLSADTIAWPVLKARTEGTALVDVGSYRTELSGLKLDGDNRVTYALRCQASNSSVLQDIHAINATGDAILLDDASLFASRLIGEGSNRGIVLRGCNAGLFLFLQALQNDSHGLVVEGQGSGNTAQSGNCTILGGQFDVNCRAESNSAEILIDGAEQVILRGLYIEADPERATNGVRVVNGAANCVFSDLRFVLDDGAKAFVLESMKGGTISDCGANIGADTIYQESADGGVGCRDISIRGCRATSSGDPRSFRLIYYATDLDQTTSLVQSISGELVQLNGSDAPPTSGRWRVGDQVGSYRCIVSGNPGTWEATIATEDWVSGLAEATYASFVVPANSGMALPGATMGPVNDSISCAIDAQEYSDFSEAVGLALTINGNPRYPRAIKALDVSSGTNLQVTTIAGNVRNFTVSAGELVEVQCSAIGTGTTCDRVRVYW